MFDPLLPGHNRRNKSINILTMNTRDRTENQPEAPRSCRRLIMKMNENTVPSKSMTNKSVTKIPVMIATVSSQGASSKKKTE